MCLLIHQGEKKRSQKMLMFILQQIKNFKLEILALKLKMKKNNHSKKYIILREIPHKDNLDQSQEFNR